MESKAKKGGKEKKLSLKFVIDCHKPVEDKVFSTSAFADFLKSRIKVNNKTENLGSDITVDNDAKNVTVTASVPLSKRYLKYLTKKYIKKHSLTQFLYVAATNKLTYQIRYFNIQKKDEEE